MEQNRIETGAVQFGDDWPCVVIRGDNAMWYAHLMDIIDQQCKEKGVDMGMLGWDSFRALLGSCTAQPIDKGQSPCQFLKSYKECLQEQDDDQG